MPLYMDMHRVGPGVAPEDVALAHLQDLEVQGQYRVRYLRYWFNEPAGKVFCLIDAPGMHEAITVHRESNGLVAEQIIEVQANTAEGMLGTVDEAPPWEQQSGIPAPVDSPLRTILYTDMEGSVTITQRLGDASHMELLRAHDAIFRDALAVTGGREIKHTGDGFMACFSAVSPAVECAAAVQRALHRHSEEHPDRAIRVRMGLSAGEPVEDHRDLYGAAVQLASRICQHAEPGSILASNVVRELAIGKGFLFADRGEFVAKGFEEPVRVFEVRWREG